MVPVERAGVRHELAFGVATGSGQDLEDDEERHGVTREVVRIAGRLRA
jgi:hypothetical protein